MQPKEITKQVPDSDSQFLGGYSKQTQVSIRHRQVIKDYGKIMRGEIQSMVTTSDKKILFVSHQHGGQKQVSIRLQKVVKDYGKIRNGIRSLAITADDRYLFTGDIFGNVEQFRVSDGRKIIQYLELFQGESISSIATTPDSKYLFVGESGGPKCGTLKQICLESQQVVHDYGIVHKYDIKCMQTTRDSKYLITGGEDKRVKRISIENRTVDKDFGRVFDHHITAMKILADEERLLVCDYGGNLRLMSLIDGTTIKDFGQIHDISITGIVITADEKFIFTSCGIIGSLKQWNFGDATLVRDYENLSGPILWLCL